MSRNLEDLSPWARNLVVKVRNEIKADNSLSISEGYTSFSSRDGETFHIDIYHKNMLDWDDFKEDSISEYKRLMGKESRKKYAGTLSYKEIEAIEDITK
tara:strand:+ start:288 stop:584 length:297 start_codon:yes stop_codon:yes gene_type:complete